MPTRRDLNEERFETHIVDTLHTMHGYRKRSDEKHYCKETTLDEELIWDFIQATQGETVTRLVERHGDATHEKVIKRLDSELGKRGLVDVMRQGIELDGNVGVEKIALAYFKPENNLNPETQALYERNIFSVIRQVHFSSRTTESLDLVLFLNGIPLATVELKNELTGQNVSHARQQYRTDRDPDLALFAFKRCAAHFAVDTSEVSVTTHLRSGSTYFLPFNRGYANGAGNPPMDVEAKHKTSYLWEEVWAPDSWLDLLHHYVHVFREYKEDKDGKEHAVWKQAFPRFHQRKTVGDLLAAARVEGPGHNYLIQHSAGSGKSMTIAWAAFRLAELHNAKGTPVFDSVIVLTDRRVLNQQLGETVKAFEQQRGVLAQIGEGTTSQDLKRALESGAKIITTTIHKFGVIAGAMGGLPAKHFALIVDEAHSSQSGEMRRAVHEVVGQYKEIEDWVLKQATTRQQPNNVSYFAFTATPRDETFEKFGICQPDGSFSPFSLYSMKQAIEEGFILDVLKNYTTYRAYFDLLQSSEKDPQVKKNDALRRLLRYVRTHDLMIEQKIEVIVTHFEETVRDLLRGDEKAMIVTDSRESAVRYKLALDAYLQSHGLAHKTLVAFTDTVHLDGRDYTESNMNGGLPDKFTAKEFKKRDYKFLIVAEKYQTGFDEPMLCAMYVDKTLSGVQAVQTLSRLNRTAPEKDRVFVLDFVNTADDIQKAFDPYYTSTILSEGLDMSLLGDTRRAIFDLYRVNDAELDEFAAILGGAAGGDNTHAAVNAFLDRMADDIARLDEAIYEDLKSKLHFYLWLYPYVAQVLGYVDVSHEKLFLLLHPLAKKLPRKRREKSFPVEHYVDLQTLRVIKKHCGSIVLDPATAGIDQPIEIPNGMSEEDEIVALSEIVGRINKKWGTTFGLEQQTTLETMSGEFAADAQLQNVVKNPANQKSGAKIVFDHKFDDKVHETYERDDKLYTQLMNNEELRKFVQREMFNHVFGRILAESAGIPAPQQAIPA